MQKKITVLLFFAIILSGCGKEAGHVALTANEEEFVTGTDDGATTETIIEISLDESREHEPQPLETDGMVVIANPESADPESSLLMIDPADLRRSKVTRMTDLSWLGFLQPVRISGISAGNVTGDSEKAGCLVLVVSSPDGTAGEDNYVVLLDYANQKSYRLPTVIPYASIQSTDITLSDVTGDGLAEIIVSVSPNAHHTGVVFEVVRFTGDGLKSIYQRDISMNSAADNYFTAALADDYKVKVSCPVLGCSEVKLLSDAGLWSSDLEIGMADHSEENMDVDDIANRCYEEGKVVRDGVRMGLLNSVTVPEGDEIMELEYSVYLGRWENVASVTACLEYDSDADMLVITGARIN